MKFRMQFKTPGVVEQVFREYASKTVERDRDEMLDAIEKFVRFHECVTIEFDAETMTASVVPVTK